MPIAVKPVDGSQFFYALESYCDEKVDPKDLTRLPLDRYHGTTVVRIWSPSLNPGRNDFQTYNSLYKKYGSHVHFVGAIFQTEVEKWGSAQSVAKQSEESVKKAQEQFVHGGFAVFGGETTFLALLDKLNQQNVEAQMKASDLQSKFQEDRHPFCVSLQTMVDRGDRFLFPEVILDNAETRDYLVKGDSELPLTVILQDGRLIGAPKDPTSLERQIKGITN